MYWTDIGAHAKTGRVRGRIILPGARSTSDFDVALDGANKPRIFSLVASGVSCAAPCHYWYGDYQTASGYQTVHVVPGGIAPAYDFFPMWIEPDGAVHYTLAARKRLGAAQDGIAICPLQCRVARAKSGVGQGCGVKSHKRRSWTHSGAPRRYAGLGNSVYVRALELPPAEQEILSRND